MPLRIFRSRSVSGANLVQMLMVAALFSFQILVALYLQKVLGYGAAETGLAMLPAAVVIGAVSLGVSARLNARFGERNVLLAGLVLLLGVARAAHPRPGARELRHRPAPGDAARRGLRARPARR